MLQVGQGVPISMGAGPHSQSGEKQVCSICPREAWENPRRTALSSYLDECQDSGGWGWPSWTHL